MCTLDKIVVLLKEQRKSQKELTDFLGLSKINSARQMADSTIISCNPSVPTMTLTLKLLMRSA